MKLPISWPQRIFNSFPSRFTFLERWSLRLRLCVFFIILVVITWLIAAIFAWLSSKEHIDEFFDTQQMLFANRLATMDFDDSAIRKPQLRQFTPGTDSGAQGKQESNAIGFAVFNNQGQLLLNDGERGDRFIFDAHTRGFINAKIHGSDQLWRIVWLDSLDGLRVVAVGQKLRYRNHVALEILKKQIAPWLIILPILLFGLLLIVNRSLMPLRTVVRELEKRPPDDTSPFEAKQVPSDVRPLIKALNRLFTRIAAMLTRERAFISDAAHELRSPLMALLVQAELAGLSEDDPTMRKEALTNLLYGIHRSRRLVEQLLTLSRLESIPAIDEQKGALSNGMEVSILDWALLLDEAQEEHAQAIKVKQIKISMDIISTDIACRGYPAIIALLLRNLFDNAVTYTKEKGEIRIVMDGEGLTMENTGAGISDANLARLTERFFRPPGQTEAGSGLGLSIVKRITDIHGFKLSLTNNIKKDRASAQKGFAVRISFS